MNMNMTEIHGIYSDPQWWDFHFHSLTKLVLMWRILYCSVCACHFFHVPYLQNPILPMWKIPPWIGPQGFLGGLQNWERNNKNISIKMEIQPWNCDVNKTETWILGVSTSSGLPGAGHKLVEYSWQSQYLEQFYHDRFFWGMLIYCWRKPKVEMAMVS